MEWFGLFHFKAWNGNYIANAVRRFDADMGAAKPAKAAGVSPQDYGAEISKVARTIHKTTVRKAFSM